MQMVMSRGSASGPWSFTSSRVRRRVPVPVAGGEPAGGSDAGGGIPKTNTLMGTEMPRAGDRQPHHRSVLEPGCGSWCWQHVSLTRDGRNKGPFHGPHHRPPPAAWQRRCYFWQRATRGPGGPVPSQGRSRGAQPASPPGRVPSGIWGQRGAGDVAGLTGIPPRPRPQTHSCSLDPLPLGRVGVPRSAGGDGLPWWHILRHSGQLHQRLKHGRLVDVLHTDRHRGGGRGQFHGEGGLVGHGHVEHKLFLGLVVQTLGERRGWAAPCCWQQGGDMEGTPTLVVRRTASLLAGSVTMAKAPPSLPRRMEYTARHAGVFSSSRSVTASRATSRPAAFSGTAASYCGCAALSVLQPGGH